MPAGQVRRSAANGAAPAGQAAQAHANRAARLADIDDGFALQGFERAAVGHFRGDGADRPHEVVPVLADAQAHRLRGFAEADRAAVAAFAEQLEDAVAYA